MKGEEEKGDDKAAGISVNSAWHLEPVAAFLQLLPALVTPMVSLNAQCWDWLSGFLHEFRAGLQWQAWPPRVPLARVQWDLLKELESLQQSTFRSWYKTSPRSVRISASFC